MKILLDENLPRQLVAALRAEGHDTESVHTLQLQGLENGKLYELACTTFDICFTRDLGFAHNVRQSPVAARIKLLRVRIPQKPQEAFVREFIKAFRESDWARFGLAMTGRDSPAFIKINRTNPPRLQRVETGHGA